MEPDPIISEIRKVREKLMEEANGDLRQLAESARRTAERLGFKFVTREQMAEMRARDKIDSDGESRRSKIA